MKKKISRKEFAWYVGCAIVFAIGFIIMIIGIVADHLSIDNPLRQFQPAITLRFVGLIIIAGAVVFCIGVLLYNAKKSDRVSDRETRRKQRLQAMLSDSKDTAETVILNKDGTVEQKKAIEEKEKDALQDAQTINVAKEEAKSAAPTNVEEIKTENNNN